MQRLNNIPADSYAKLLGAQVIDASKGALFSDGKKIAPATNNRTILIGLGGTGVQTLDHVKGAIKQNLDATWSNYIAFLAIDSDYNEIDGAKYLSKGIETVNITETNVDQRYQNPMAWPRSWKKIVPRNGNAPAMAIQGLSNPGCGQKRLIGRMKLHDQVPGSAGVDEQIVQKLAGAINNLAGLGSGSGVYEFYVIGSVCGGTCSGCFLEMPALIKRAMSSRPYRVNAILYLPDVCQTLDPGNAPSLKANGYASLKELDYYQGLMMRSGYAEAFQYNDSATQVNELRDKFYDVPYLIGKAPGAGSGNIRSSKEVVAEFLISTLGRMSAVDNTAFFTDSLMSNVSANMGARDPGGNPETEAYGAAHEHPKTYASFGYAMAAAPQKIVHAYMVDQVCSVAGLKSVEPEERARLIAAGAPLIPYRGKKDYEAVQEGLRSANDILKPVVKLFQVIHNGEFSLAGDLQQEDITATKIMHGEYDGLAPQCNGIVNRRTDTNSMKALEQEVRAALAQVRQNVQEYVRENGPFAFTNLYEGRLLGVSDGQDVSMKAMLLNFPKGKMMNGAVYGWLDPASADQNLKNAFDVINRMGLLKRNLWGSHAEDVNNWIRAFENAYKARINAARRGVALGQNGYIQKNLVEPLMTLADDIKTFGYVLENLANIYMGFAANMASYEAFAHFKDQETEYNLGAINTSAYHWLKQQADGQVQVVSGLKLRTALVDDFFANSKEWLEIPDNRIKPIASGGYALTTADWAIPARERFDQLVAQQFVSALDSSILHMFAYLDANGSSFAETARIIMDNLEALGKVQFSGDLPANATYCYLIYPSSLGADGGSGPAIQSAIITAAQAKWGAGVITVSSDDADCIRFYRQAAPFEIYKLAELPDWERNYEEAIINNNNGVHGISQCFTVDENGYARETFPWMDYPSLLAYANDPTVRDPRTGRISREGQLRLQVRQVVEEARKLGVLYSEQTSSGKWMIYRVFCDKSIAWNRFSIASCSTDENGFLPMGKALADSVATQHGKKLADIASPVRLSYGGVMDMAMTEEADAWKYAERIVRAHVPMYMEILDTLALFRQWGGQIDQFNQVRRDIYKPAMMVDMMESGVLTRDTAAWKLTKGEGENPITVLNLSMIDFLQGGEKAMLQNGLVAYYLYNKLFTMLPGGDFDAVYAYSKRCREQLISAGDLEQLKLNRENAALVEREREALREKGARLDGNEGIAPAAKFKAAMAQIVPDQKMLAEIDQFYYRTALTLH